MYSTKDAVRWMLDIACGLQYLHSRHPMVIHRDLKLENILLKGDS
jgi:serine/threonine protein kinase